MKGRILDTPIEILFDVARRPEVVQAMWAFYAQADHLIARKTATCWNKGECCQFGRFGHRLYVTALEVCYYLCDTSQLPDADQNTEVAARRGGMGKPRACAWGSDEPCEEASPIVTDDVCPHSYEGQCHARDRRPLGCRVFYCDPEAQAWQGPLTEDLLAKLRAMHHELNVPYFYVDWMLVLRALRSSGAAGTIP